MEPVLMYLLKMITCSIVLFSYYRLALYNERFHQWNRFYLLAAILLSVIVPFISIPIMVPPETDRLASVVYSLPWVTEAPITHNWLSWQKMATFLSLLVTGILLIKMLVAVIQIIRLHKINPATNLQHNVWLVITTNKEAPFSFFNWLFWRNDIDPDSENGKRILMHELTHIRQLHSVDKIFTSLVLCIFWMNPIFWLIKKELNAIHEFLADNKAVNQKDGNSFAQMILQVIPTSHTRPNGLVNPFFSSQIKRRLHMITSSKTPKHSYLRRVSGLVIMISATFLLAVTLQNAEAQSKKVIKKQNITSTATDTPATKIVITKKAKARTSIEKPVDGNEKITKTKVKIKGGDNPLILLNGKQITRQEMNNLDPQAIQTVNIKKPAATENDGTNAYDGVIEITLKSPGIVGEADKQNHTKTSNDEVETLLKKQQPIYIVDGKEISYDKMQKIKPDEIEMMNVFKGEAATKKYGEKAKDGVVEITLKKPVT